MTTITKKNISSLKKKADSFDSSDSDESVEYNFENNNLVSKINPITPILEIDINNELFIKPIIFENISDKNNQFKTRKALKNAKTIEQSKKFKKKINIQLDNTNSDNDNTNSDNDNTNSDNDNTNSDNDNTKLDNDNTKLDNDNINSDNLNLDNNNNNNLYKKISKDNKLNKKIYSPDNKLKKIHSPDNKLNKKIYSPDNKLKKIHSPDDIEFKSIFNRNDLNSISNIPEIIRINIRVFQRNSRKLTTTIENIPKQCFDNQNNVINFLKNIRNAISTRATLKITENGDKIIEVSGNNIDIMIPIICKFVNCEKSDISIYGI